MVSLGAPGKAFETGDSSNKETAEERELVQVNVRVGLQHPPTLPK